MKRFSILAIALFTIFFYACEEISIPDLNPGTAEGGDILIYDIDETILYSSQNGSPTFHIDNTNLEIDLFDDGSVDLILKTIDGSGDRYLYLQLTSEVGRDPNLTQNFLDLFDDVPVFLPVDALTGSTFDGSWGSPNTNFEMLISVNTNVFGGPLAYNTGSRFPTGLSYIPTRTQSGNDWYYGWIEIFASDYGDGDTDDFLLISRFGISQTPGLRVRMGWE